MAKGQLGRGRLDNREPARPPPHRLAEGQPLTTREALPRITAHLVLGRQVLLWPIIQTREPRSGQDLSCLILQAAVLVGASVLFICCGPSRSELDEE